MSGGRRLNPAPASDDCNEAEQTIEAWLHVRDGYDAALRALAPEHPDRPRFQRLYRLAAQCANQEVMRVVDS